MKQYLKMGVLGKDEEQRVIKLGQKHVEKQPGSGSTQATDQRVEDVGKRREAGRHQSIDDACHGESQGYEGHQTVGERRRPQRTVGSQQHGMGHNGHQQHGAEEHQQEDEGNDAGTALTVAPCVQADTLGDAAVGHGQKQYPH